MFHESKEFHRGSHAHRRADLQQLAVSRRAHGVIGHARRWTGDDVRRAQFRRLRHPPFAFLQRGGILRFRSIEPAGHVNGGRHGQSLVRQRALNIRQRTAIRQVRVQVVMPKLDRAVPCLARDANLVEQRHRANRAGV